MIGPLLASVGSEIGMNLGLPMYAGAYLVPVVSVGLAAILSFTFLRPDPYELADAHGRRGGGPGPEIERAHPVDPPPAGRRAWRSSRSSSASS